MSALSTGYGLAVNAGGLTRLMHAARQLVWHVRARPAAPPMWVTPAEARLFESMAPPDQLEGLAVVHTLEAWGWAADRELLVAGLLHDAGKRLAPPSALFRVLYTAVDALSPRLLEALARWNESLCALLKHPATGADLATAAGLPAGVAALIAGHHQPAWDSRMVALQQADALH